jgi:hypothetical protein
LAQWVQAIQERKSSGETITDFCQRKGVNRNTYFYWQQKIRKTACEKLTEIQGIETQTGLAIKGFTEIKVAETPMLPVTAPASQICIEAGRYKITTDSGYPAEVLASLLRELLRPC